MFDNLVLQDDVVTGLYRLSGMALQVGFDREAEAAKLDDYSALIAEAEKRMAWFGMPVLEKLKEEMSTALTDSAYEGTGYQPLEQDYTALKQELQLRTIRFFPEGITVLELEAPGQYPDMLVYCQVDAQFEMEEVTVAAR